MERGISKVWGAFVGEVNGFAVWEGTEVEIAALTNQYVPFVRFDVKAYASVDEVAQIVENLMK